ncbi:MAG: segregation/condensation protein A, partial [Anaerolineae bacterium]|nr:segregation/condensation protein A [Anaerolineae bacterium]
EREPGEEDPGDMLVQQLLLYKRYKEIAQFLAEREELGLKTYLRTALPPKVEGKLDLSDVSVMDLAAAAERIFSQVDHRAPLDTVVKAPRVTIREKIKLITQTLRVDGKTTFRTLLGEKRSRVDIVVTFLAMLELVKRFRVAASQSNLFGDIELSPAEEWSDEADFELEFTE